LSKNHGFLRPPNYFPADNNSSRLARPAEGEELFVTKLPTVAQKAAMFR
jgi:hypothetical protein